MRLLLTAFVVLFSAATCFSIDIVLVDGRYLHVKVLDHSASGVKVKLLDTEGEIFIPWGVIAEPYKTELRRGLGYEENEADKLILEPGVRITTKQEDVYEGRIEAENDEEITLKHEGKKVVLKKAMVKEVEKTQVPVTSIYTSQEYLEKYIAEKKPADDSPSDQLDLAGVAEKLDLYDQATAALNKVKAIDPEFQATLIKNRLDRLDLLSKNKAFRDSLTEANKLANATLFTKAREVIARLEEDKAMPEALKAELSVIKERVEKKRWDHFRRLVAADYEGTLRNKIGAMARDPKVTLDDARRKLRADLHKEVVAEIAARHGLDPKGEVEKMWSERGWNSPRRASYGSGSFIVLGKAPEAAQLEAQINKQMQDFLRQQQRQNGGKQSGGSVSAQPDRLPKPPTKEEWWTKVSDSTMRASWMLAFWAENAKKVELIGEYNDDCERCGSKGWLEFSGSQGDNLRVTCPSCQGHKRYKGVAFK